MDVVKQSVDKFLEGGRGVLEDLRLVDPKSMWQQILELDWRVNTSLILLSTALGGFIFMFALANLFPESSAVPSAIKDNFALGSSSSAAKSKSDAPPIPPPTEVISLRIYPIKSCRGIELSSTRLRKTGLLLDRNWMFVDRSNNKFMTIREDASMTLIDTKIITDDKSKDKEQMLEISIHGTDGRVVIPAFPTKPWLEANTKLQDVEIWGKETDAYMYGDEVNKIFCDFFNKSVGLVYKGPTARMVAVNGKKELYGKDQPHHFADVMSLQVASMASIKDLNRRLKERHGDAAQELTIERYRPNIIVRGRDDHPWEEDTWKRIRITTTIHQAQSMYKLDLDAVARCPRCQVPNVNPDTAEKSNMHEPWNETMKFRRIDQGHKYKPCFGMLCIPRNEGIVEVGATLEVLETTNNHLFDKRKFSDL